MENHTIVYTYQCELPSPSTKKQKLAIFDVDGTLMKPKDGRPFPKDKDDWMWLRASVPTTLQTYSQTYQIVFLTDQTKQWKVDMVKELCTILNIPIIACISMDKDYNKPNDALFKSVFPKYSKKSFYVGDAAGRKDDWSDCDKVIATKLQIPFYTPEEVFLMDAVQENNQTYASTEKEVVILVGMQGSGKSTLAKQKFSEHYTIISGDVYKTAEKMLKEASKYDSSIIFDATNGTKQKRKLYLDYARSKNLPVRCIWNTAPIDVCMERNKQREAETGTHVPKIALYKYRKDFEEPDESEGFTLVNV